MHPALLTVVLLLGASLVASLSIDGVRNIETLSTQVSSACEDTDGLCQDLVCSHKDISVTLSVAKLNEKKIDIPYIYLRDRRCTGFPSDGDKVQITWSLGHGVCGTDLTVTNTHGIYKNQIFLPPGGIVYREIYVINVTCSYPLDLNVTLPDIIRPDPSITHILIENNGQFKVQMAVYTDISYTTPYTDHVIDLSTKNNLYVGVYIVEPTYDYSLLMVNCYATPSSNFYDATKYYIIANSCPNPEDNTIRILENGVSHQGKFYVQVFKFVGDYTYVYLHCQVHLCRNTCAPSCSARAAADVPAVQGTLSIGPLRLAADSECESNRNSVDKLSAFGIMSLIGLLLMNKLLL